LNIKYLYDLYEEKKHCAAILNNGAL